MNLYNEFSIIKPAMMIIMLSTQLSQQIDRSKRVTSTLSIIFDNDKKRMCTPLSSPYTAHIDLISLQSSPLDTQHLLWRQKKTR